MFYKYKSTLAASTPAGKYDATPYLFVTGRYREVLDNCRELKEVLGERIQLIISIVAFV